MIGFKARSYLILFVSVFAAIALNACTAPVVQPPEDSVTVEESKEPIEPNIPDVELTSELLYKLMLADLSYFRNDPHTSVEILEEVAFETRDPRIAGKASVRAINHGRMDVAANTVDLWVELSPENFGSWFSRAAVKIGTGNYEGANDDLMKALMLAPDEVELTNQIATLFWNNFGPDVAFELWSNLMSAFPENQAGLLHLINFALSAELSNEEIEALIASAEKFIEDDDFIARVRFTVYRRTDRAYEGEEFAQGHLYENPDSPTLRLDYAQHLSEKWDYSEAVHQFEQLDVADALRDLGELHLRANYPDLAYRSFLAYHAKRPEDQSVLLNLADISLTQMRYEDAREWINQIRSPRLAFSRISLSAQYIADTEGVEQGVELLREYEPRDEQDRVRVYLAISEIYRSAGKFEESLDTLDRAIKEMPVNASLLLSRSYVYAELNQVDLVERDVNELLVLDPDNPHALNALGYVLADNTDRLDEAMELLEKALEFEPHNPYILDSMGWLQFKLGNVELAIEFLESALAGRDDPIIAAHLGEVYWTAGDRRKARRIWDQALNKTPDDEILTETVDRFIN